MQDLPFKDPLVIGVLVLLGMVGSAFAVYGTWVVLAWVYGMRVARHTRFASGEELLPLRGRWLRFAVTAVATLVAGPLLLLSVIVFVICGAWLLSLLFNRH